MSAPLMTKPVYIALDIDGVLHPLESAPYAHIAKAYGEGKISAVSFLDACNRLTSALGSPPILSNIHHLEEIIKSLDGRCRIVIASSWVRYMSVEAVKALLPRSVSELVVGAIDFRLISDDVWSSRSILMAHFLAKNADGDAVWIGIDDQLVNYWHHSNHLVQTDSRRGLTDRDIPRVRSTVDRLSKTTSHPAEEDAA